jgi:hypothetical protein
MPIPPAASPLRIIGTMRLAPAVRIDRVAWDRSKRQSAKAMLNKPLYSLIRAQTEADSS